MTIEIPEEIYKDDRACGEFIFSINERLAKISAIEKELKKAKEVAVEVMLTRLSATGQKHFAFENLGTFSKTTKTSVSYPTAEQGGKEVAVQWLVECLQAGVIAPEQLLDLQQARLVTDPVLAIERAVEKHNRDMMLSGGKLLPASPFNHYEQVTLSTPRVRKS